MQVLWVLVQLCSFSQGVGMRSEKSGLTLVQMKICDDKSDDTSKERSQVAIWVSQAILIISRGAAAGSAYLNLGYQIVYRQF